MTKLIAILSAVLFTAFSLTAASPAVRADEQEFFDLSGVVVEMNDEMILIEDADGSQVQVNLFEDTTFEGDAIVPGTLIFVVYNGMMTRSLPPQVAAIKVSCFAFTGEIAEMGVIFCPRSRQGGTRRRLRKITARGWSDATICAILPFQMA